MVRLTVYNIETDELFVEYYESEIELDNALDWYAKNGEHYDIIGIQNEDKKRKQYVVRIRNRETLEEFEERYLIIESVKNAYKYYEDKPLYEILYSKTEIA